VLLSRALWAARLVASDGCMNVANERPSVESDEETFIDLHGRSLHLVGADVLHEQERPATPDATIARYASTVETHVESAVSGGSARSRLPPAVFADGSLWDRDTFGRTSPKFGARLLDRYTVMRRSVQSRHPASGM
jgi:hypothetical protein